MGMPFQFTHPGRGATTSNVSSIVIGGFNSRTPGGVRRIGRGLRVLVDVVSIHAPWEGCDYGCTAISLTCIRFQFTHPGKGATDTRTPLQLEAMKFQFTHPGKGATEMADIALTIITVSIHAPWEGCDSPSPR